ncbi:MAG: hypothetical protein GTO02_04645 [Candidatus Dadabacteria bacterium]|nr:hypothetical protein [Candidatus Dadabacteria bacterium]NIQ13703.1 hypothetical protein [Candidatus Dadabacteria bacterium]
MKHNDAIKKAATSAVKKVNKKLIDKATGREVIQKTSDDLKSFSMKEWLKGMKTGGMVNPNVRSMTDVAKEAMMKAKMGREIPRGY